MDFTGRIKDVYHLPEDGIQLLWENVEVVSFRKKEVVVEEGGRDDFIYFVSSGSVRGYVCREGKERTFMFAFEGDVAGTVLGMTGRATARMNIETMEDTILLKISRKVLEEIFSSSVEMANWGRRLMEKSLLEYEHYFIDYFWANKSIQYRMIMKEYPELLQRVSLKELASYLNVTPQTLSRIRAGLR